MGSREDCFPKLKSDRVALALNLSKRLPPPRWSRPGLSMMANLLPAGPSHSHRGCCLSWGLCSSCSLCLETPPQTFARLAPSCHCDLNPSSEAPPPHSQQSGCSVQDTSHPQLDSDTPPRQQSIRGVSPPRTSSVTPWLTARTEPRACTSPACTCTHTQFLNEWTNVSIESKSWPAPASTLKGWAWAVPC